MVDISVFSKDCGTIYNEKILPIMQKLEPERKKRLRKNIIIETLSIIGLLVSLWLFTTPFVDSHPGWICCFVVVSLAGTSYLFAANKEFKNLVKAKYMTEIMQCIKYIKWKKSTILFKENDLINTKLFGKFNKWKIDDSFTGTYRKVKFDIQETELVLSGRRYYASVFKGVILSFSSNKEIKTDLIISSDKTNVTLNQIPILKLLLPYIIPPIVIGLIFMICVDPKHFISGLQYVVPQIIILPFLPHIIVFSVVVGIFLFINYLKKRNYKNIQLEDVEFAKKFVVLSGDEVEARYLLTTSFMERLNNLKTVFGSKNIKCSYIGDKITFAIPTNKDLFEFVSLYKPATNIDTMRDFYAQLSAIFDLIEYFKLDENTGL